MNKDFAQRQLDLLRVELQTAIEIEHTTVPPYLTAWFSIHPESNREVQPILRAVVMQEMLHMTLAANVLNAVGGEPIVDDPKFVPGYPTNLPWHAPGFSVGLERFSRRQIEKFWTIEEPAPDDVWADYPELAGLGVNTDGARLLGALTTRNAAEPPRAHGYQSLGQFYKAVILRLVWVTLLLGEDQVFTGDPARQVRPEHYYGGGGQVIEVHDLASAVRALWTIIVQGEGGPSIWDGSHEPGTPLELAHFYAYDEILQGRSYRPGDQPLHPTGPVLPVEWEAAYPMRPNPKRQQYEHAPEIFAKLDAFDKIYFRLLHAIHDAFNGKPDRFRAAVAEMYELKYRAVELMRTPDPLIPRCHVGPSWGSLPAGTHPARALFEGKHRLFAAYPELLAGSKTP
ncbi:MAG: ferritin-like protein [Minicystis sp.]